MRLKVIALVLLGLLLGYSGYWVYISQHTDAYLRNLATSLAQNNGITINYDSYRVTGFPYRLVLTFQNPSLIYRNGPLTAEMTAGTLEAVLQPWNLSHVILMSESSRTKVSFGAGNPKQFLLEPGTFSLSVHSGGENALRVSASWANVALSSNTGPWVPPRLASLEFHLRRLKTDGVEEGQLLEPKALELALRAEAADGGVLAANLAFHGREVPHVTRNGLGPWRDQGGTLEVETLTLEGPGLHVAGSGSFTLDEEFRLLGAVDVEGVSRDALAAEFVENEWMTPENAGEFLDFYSSLPPDAMPEGADNAFSITAQDGWLSLGPVRFEPIGPVVLDSD